MTTPADGARAKIFAAALRPLQAFLRLQAASGLILLGCAIVALAWANTNEAAYRSVIDYPVEIGARGCIARFTFAELVNDGLMTLFFFVVGMEIKRELAIGELATVRQAILPAIAALGGMAAPAGVFLVFNGKGEGAHGWGIPMATDIAFSVGILTLLGPRVPRPLVVFLTALAIFDDIGGILVIALFYGSGVHGAWLLLALGVTAVLLVMNRWYIRSGVAYALVGAALWYALHHGGIHATIAGVVTGLAIPAHPPRSAREVLRQRSMDATEFDRRLSDEELDAAAILNTEEKRDGMPAPLNRFVHALHPYVAFAIMPLFALANSGVSIASLGIAALATPVAMGTALGLLVGKQVGVFAATTLAVRLGVAKMPGNAPLASLYGVSTIAGIGFTVALFIAALAYRGREDLLAEAKLGILVGSLASGVLGYAVLRWNRGLRVT